MIKQNDSEVLWIKLLPAQMKGGPKSKFQQRLKQSNNVVQNTSPSFAPVSAMPPIGQDSSFAKGGSVHTEKFKHLAEKLKSEGKEPSSAFAIATKALGYEGSIKKGHRRKKGYEEGGTVSPMDEPGEYTGDDGENIYADKVNEVKTFKDHEGEFYVNAPMVAMIGGPDKVEEVMVAAAQKKRNNAANGLYEPNGEGKPIMSEQDAGKSMVPLSDIRSSFALGGSIDSSNSSTPNDSEYDPEAGFYAAKAARNAAATQPQYKLQAPTADELAADPNAEGTRQLIAPPLAIKTPEQIAADQQAELDAYMPPQGATTSAPPLTTKTTIPTTTAVAPLETPIVSAATQALINSTLQKNGANTAAGKAELQMSLAQKGITGTAAQAALDSFDRAARINASTMQTSLLQQGTAEQQTNNKEALANILQTGDLNNPNTIAQYKSMYKSVYGIEPDTTQIQQAYSDAQYTAAQGKIADQIATDNSTTIDTPKMKDYLQKMWENSGHTGTVDATWANQQFSRIKDSEQPMNQYANSLTPDVVLNNWFGGDSGSLSRFTYGVDANGKPLTGIEAFKKWIPAMITSGGATLDADGNITIDKTNSMVADFFAGHPSKAGESIPADAKVSGTTLTVGNTDYKILSGDKTNGKIVDPTNNKVYDIKNGIKTANSDGIQVQPDGTVTSSGILIPGISGKKNETTGLNEFTDTKTGRKVTLDNSTGKDGIPSVSKPDLTVKNPITNETNTNISTLSDGRQISKSKDNSLWITSSDGVSTEKITASNLTDVYGQDATTNAALVKGMVNVSDATGTPIFTSYLASVNNKPDAKVLSFFVDNNDKSAVDYATKQLMDGTNRNFYYNSNVQDGLSSKSVGSLSSNPDAGEYFAKGTKNGLDFENTVGKSVVENLRAGDVINVDGVFYKVKTTDYSTVSSSQFGAKNRRRWTLTFENIADGTSKDFHAVTSF